MEKIKLPRSSYEELVKIITAYGALNKPSGLLDVIQASGIPKTVVSANNAFLAFTGIVEGGNKKMITSKGLALARALEHQMEAEEGVAWREIIDENDFLTKMVQAVKIRRGMESSQFENHIAFSSGEKNSTGVRTGARAVVDILLNSGILKQEGDKIIYDNSSSSSSSTPYSIDNKLNLLAEEVNVQEPPQVEPKEFAIPHVEIRNGISLKIELSINARPDELDGLGAKLKKLIDELSEDE
ncbi:MAG: hypothetical protein AAFY76_04775 [Cyanobacteria bacterium J06649_11]